VAKLATGGAGPEEGTAQEDGATSLSTTLEHSTVWKMKYDDWMV